MTDMNPSNRDPLSKRLRGLRSTPVNLVGFDAQLHEALPPMPARDHGWLETLRQMLTPVRAAMACLLVVGVIGTAAIILSGQPAIASPQHLAEAYRSSLAGHQGSTPITTIADAPKTLGKKWPDSPQLADEPAGMKPMSCCVHEVGRRQLACVTFIVDEQPVMLALAAAKDVRSAHGAEMTIGNTTYITGNADGINMVMNERDGTWMCLMGNLPHERLADLARSLRE